MLLVTATVALGVSTLLVSRERNEAEAQGQQARQAVHLLTKVADIGFDDQLDPLQEEFLENALAYYEQFTGRVSRDPAVRLEHGRAYQQMGDIHRKLGRLPESEAAYRKAVEMLEPLATAGTWPARRSSRWPAPAPCWPTSWSAAGPTRARPTSSTGRRCKPSECWPTPSGPGRHHRGHPPPGPDLEEPGRPAAARRQGSPGQAGLRPGHRRARAGPRRGQEPRNQANAETRDELALAIDARGWIHRELGDSTRAEADYRQALELLEKLVAEFPTVPRHRESLAKACNSLGLIEESTGRLADAEGHLRRELPLVERLAEDFPDRPEHRRVLARTLTNLGSVLLGQDRAGEAEPILRRAIAVNDAIAAKLPDDVQIRLDLAKDHNNLGEVLRSRETPRRRSRRSVRRAGSTRNWSRSFPIAPLSRVPGAQSRQPGPRPRVDCPGRGRGDSPGRGRALRKAGRRPSRDVEYQIGRARCLMNQGVALASARRFDRAEAIYRQALAQVETKDAKAQTLDRMRLKVQLLNDLVAVLRDLERPEAEPTLRQALAAFEELAARATATPTDRHNVAIAQFNMGDTLIDLERSPEAAPFLAKAEAGFARLLADAPKSVDYHSQLGLVLARTASSWPTTARPPRPRPCCNAPSRSRPGPWSSARIATIRAPCSVATCSPWSRST